MFDGAAKVIKRAIIVIIIVALITPLGAHSIAATFFHDMSLLIFGHGGGIPSISVNNK